MKLLLDENISRRIVPFLENAYPGSTQVTLIGLERASDARLWEYAKQHHFVIVTKDSDYYDMSLLQGAPPQVIWLRTGNIAKAKITQLLLDHREPIEKILLQDEIACVEIF